MVLLDQKRLDVLELMGEVERLRAEIIEAYKLGAAVEREGNEDEHEMLCEAMEDVERLEGENASLQRERDAALVALQGKCSECIHADESMTSDSSPCFEVGLICLPKGYLPNCEHWKWRGPQDAVETC